MVQDIAFGMNYLHTLTPPIIHRDLKLENVFVGVGFEVKVSTFQFCFVTGYNLFPFSNVKKKQNKTKQNKTYTHPHIPQQKQTNVCYCVMRVLNNNSNT